MNELIPEAEALAHAETLNAIRPTGLSLPTRLSPRDYYCLAIQIKLMGDSTGYARADLAARIKQDFPNREEHEARWEELATLWGKVFGTIQSDAKVGERFTHEERGEWMEMGVPYSYLRVVSNLDNVEQRDYYLRQCVTEGWKFRRLCAEIWGAPTPPKQLPAPSRDVKYMREKYSEWVESLPPESYLTAQYYFGKFFDWLESS